MSERYPGPEVVITPKFCDRPTLEIEVEMTSTILVAVISGMVAVISVVLSFYATVRTIRIQNDLEMRRQQATSRDAIEELMARYRNPLLRSAIDLQGRIYSIMELDFIKRHLENDDAEWADYAKTSTLFRIAEFFGWIEILRRGVQFLNLGDQGRSRELSALLQQISLTFANTHQFPNSAFRLFRDEQRAIGELVVEALPGDQRGYQCMGYAQFADCLDREPAFSRWFSRLGGEMNLMIDPLPGCMDRLTSVHSALVSLLEFLDPGGIRYPTANPDMKIKNYTDRQRNREGSGAE